ncbi:metallophosphoesterase family protein [Jiulongibacter sp. NS-SX5]|uniref:metallophosphoesterase family protein n=1 Tax=Jiulongibacter sp. NS-SX5 TaxID=3463854 RepID=UPI00405A0B67
MDRRRLLKKMGVLTAGLGFGQSGYAQANEKKLALRIAHITDVHIQSVMGASKGFQKCLHHIQNSYPKPDFIFNGGDSIMGAKNSPQLILKKQFKLFNSILEQENSLPVYHCIGNHDLWYGNKTTMKEEKEKVMESLNFQSPYYKFEQNGWHFIVLDGVQPAISKKKYVAKIDEQQLNWLKETLEQIPVNEHIMIMSHIPILSASVFFDGKNFIDNQWRISGSWMHADAQELIRLFYQYPNIKLAISGHIHLLDKVEYNGISYCCNGAVSGNWWKGRYRQTTPGYAMIDLFSNGDFEVNYQDYTS